MRIFVSYSTSDQSNVMDLVDSIRNDAPDLDMYLAPRSNVGGSYWLPRLGQELERSDAVLLLLGNRVGAWQELEYFEALRFNRKVSKPRIVPVLLGEDKPGLPFLNQFHALKRDRTGIGLIVHALTSSAADDGAGEQPAWRQANPYHGLRAYTSQDAAYFFGRDTLTGALIDALADRRTELLMLVGNSGVGKSSLVFAGLFSALRSQIRPDNPERDWPAALTDSIRWQTVTCRPHTRPVKALALGFTSLWIMDAAEADAQANAWVRNLCGGSTLADLTALARKKLAEITGDAGPTRFLLYVDQCEELYARSDPAEARVFASLLAEAAELEDTVPLATLRADYYGQLQADRTLFQVSRRLDIPPFDREALTAVITRPAQRLSARIDAPDMVTMVAEAAEDEPGALPLLSFLLTEAWDRMLEAGDGVFRLTRDVLDLSGPLIDRAEAFVSAYPERIDALRRLVSRQLVHVPKDGEILRRRAFRPDFPDDDWDVATTLASPDWRLLTLGEEAGVPVVDVAHETLLREWPRAARWIDAEREFLIWRGTLENARRTWKAAPDPSRDDAVLMGLALATAEDWLAMRGDALSAADRAFIERSHILDRARHDEEAARAKTLADERERSRHRATWISRIASAAALILLGFGSWALVERQRAETAAAAADRQADLAREAREAAEANAAVAERERRIAEASVAKYFATEASTLETTVHSARAVLLGTEAVRLDYTTQTDAALRRAISHSRWQPLAGHEGVAYDVALNGDGSRMASVGADGTVRLWDLRDPTRPHRVLYHSAESAGSVRIAGNHLVAGISGTVYVWKLDALDIPPYTFEVPGSRYTVLALSRDGTWLFTAGSARGTLRNLDDPDPPKLAFEHPVGLRAAAFGPEGRRLALAGGNAIALWDLEAPEAAPTRIEADQEKVYAIAISGDNSTLVTVGVEMLSFAYASTWKLDDLDAGSTVIRGRIGSRNFAYTSSSFIVSRDGAQLLVGSNDGTVRRWLPDRQDDNAIMFTSANRIEAVAIASKRWLAAADAGGIIHLYDMSGGGSEPRYFKSSGSPSMAVDVSADDRHMVTAVSGGAVYRQTLEFPEREPEEIHSASTDVRDIAHDPTGRWLALGESEGRVTLLDLAGAGAPPKVLDVAEGVVLSMVFSPSGDRLLAGDRDGFVEIAPETGATLRRDTGGSRMRAARFLDDDGLLTVTGDGRLLSWAAGVTEPESLADFGPEVLNAAFSPDGELLALTRANHLVHVHDLSAFDRGPAILDTGFRGSTMSVFGYALAFSPDGARLGFMGADGKGWLWRTGDLDAPPIALQGQGLMEVDIAFTSDSSFVVSGGGFDGPPKLWSLRDHLIERACGRAGRNLTLEEWRTYWGDKAYRRTCTDWALPDDLVNAEAQKFFDRRDTTASLDALGGFWASGLPHGAEPPQDIEAHHRGKMADYFVARAQAAFHSGLSSKPDVPLALAYFEAAAEIKPGFEPENSNIGYTGWNNICWRGAVWGYADKLLWACDLAVEKANGEAMAHNRDSRGVARAAAGNLAGAWEDIAAFVQHFSATGKHPSLVEKRRTWLKKLAAGENPISPEVLVELRRE